MKVKKLIMDTWFNKLVTMQNKVSNFFLQYYLILKIQQLKNDNPEYYKSLENSIATILNIGEELIERVVRFWWKQKGSNFVFVI